MLPIPASSRCKTRSAAAAEPEGLQPRRGDTLNGGLGSRAQASRGPCNQNQDGMCTATDFPAAARTANAPAACRCCQCCFCQCGCCWRAKCQQLPAATAAQTTMLRALTTDRRKGARLLLPQDAQGAASCRRPQHTSNQLATVTPIAAKAISMVVAGTMPMPFI